MTGRRRQVGLAASSMLAALLAAHTPAEAARPEPVASADAYGYVAAVTPGCSFDYIDISTTGMPFVFEASGAAPAADDGGALLPLERPFEFYGKSVATLIVSTNGYIAVAAGLDAENGGDFSNDAAVPAIPDNVPGAAARMIVYHDDLSGLPTGGQVLAEHFESCPRPSETLGDEPCTVVEWSGWSDPSGRDPFDMEAVLYHDSLLIVFQLRPGVVPLAGGTVGLQNGAAGSGSRFASPADAIGADTAVCWLEPRFPAGGAVADLELVNTDKTETVLRGRSTVYSVSVINRGPSPAQATVQDLIPPGLIDCVWFCDASEGSVCSEKGLDDIVDSVSLTANGWVDYTLVCRTTTDPQVTEVAHEATVQLLGDVTDPVPANNTGLDVDQLTSSLPECPAALVSVAFAAPFDPADPPSRVGGVVDEEGHPLRISIRRILSLEPDDAVPLGGGSGGRCEPPGTTHLRLRRDGRPAPEPIYQIEFTVDGGRGGICAAVAAVRGTAARGRFGEAPSPGASCALP